MDLLSCHYGCDEPDCEFGGDDTNGMGLAARHAIEYGHRTWADPIFHQEYRPGGDPK